MSMQNYVVLGLLSLVLAGCSRDVIPAPEAQEPVDETQGQMDDEFGSGSGFGDGEDVRVQPGPQHRGAKGHTHRRDGGNAHQTNGDEFPDRV